GAPLRETGQSGSADLLLSFVAFPHSSNLMIPLRRFHLRRTQRKCARATVSMLAAMLFGLTIQASAQTPAVRVDSAAHARPSLFQGHDLVYIAELGAAVAGTMPGDQRIERAFQRKSLQGNS